MNRRKSGSSPIRMEFHLNDHIIILNITRHPSTRRSFDHHDPIQSSDHQSDHSNISSQ